MACPCFDPGERLPGSNGSLGDLYAGLCRAAGAERPDERTTVEQCNIGYARGRCPRFPEGESSDAIRFSVAGHEGGFIRILYSLERDHRPVSHGAVEFCTGTASFRGAMPNASLERLAPAYVRSYLRRVGAGRAAAPR
ncbi:MAG TPA: hypothetical protein VL285_14405 [Bryobacteraceae bacterium]|jgi:hypothetical protein|nr:hypothetical protein [Bryobacteraceae bacterium]